MGWDKLRDVVIDCSRALRTCELEIEIPNLKDNGEEV